MYENDKAQVKQRNDSFHVEKSKERQQDNSFYNTIIQFQSIIGNRAVTHLLNNKNTEKQLSEPVQMKKENNTALPDQLKVGVENLSGISLDDVRVNFNSEKPAQVGALAYAQGNTIHLASGQESYLPHETWHVVQQKQGRVMPRMQLKGINVNDDDKLEKEADVMGRKALNVHNNIMVANFLRNNKSSDHSQKTIQMVKGHGHKSKHDRQRGRLEKIQGEERTLPIEKEKGYSIDFYLETKNPYTPDEINHFLEIAETQDKPIDIDPFRVRTMHEGVSSNFSNGEKIIELAEKFKNGEISYENIPPVNLCVIELPRREWEREDKLEPRNIKELTLFTMDHRRVVAARIAGLKTIKAIMVSNPETVRGKFTTKTRGMRIEVRKYQQKEEGAHQKNNISTLPKKSKVYKLT